MLSLYVICITCYEGRGVVSTAGYVRAHNQDEADGKAWRMCREEWPRGYDHRATAMQVPFEVIQEVYLSDQ